MTSFLGFIIAVIALAIMFFFGYLLENWRFLVWKNKGRVFRIYKEKIIIMLKRNSFGSLSDVTEISIIQVEKRLLHIFRIS